MVTGTSGQFPPSAPTADGPLQRHSVSPSNLSGPQQERDRLRVTVMANTNSMIRGPERPMLQPRSMNAETTDIQDQTLGGVNTTFGGESTSRSNAPLFPLHSTMGGMTGGAPPNQAYDATILKLQRENEGLRDLCNRHAQVIAVYQHAHPEDPAFQQGGGGGDTDHLADEERPPWMTDPEMMSPLFVHYDARISEQKAEIERLREKYTVVSTTVERLVDENEQLREAQIRDVESVLAKSASATGLQDPLGLPVDVDHAREEIMELREHLEIIKEERSIMTEQAAEQLSRLETLQRERDDLDVAGANLTEELRRAREALRYSEKEANSLQSERDNLEQRTLHSGDELSVAGARLEELNDELEELRRKTEELQSLVHTAQQERGDMERTLEAETEALQEKILSSAKRISELQTKLSSKSQEADSAKQQIRAQRRDIEQLRKDSQGMVQLLGGMEKQLNEFASRESGTETLAAECRESAEKAIMDRDTAQTAEVFLKKELERLRVMRKKESEDMKSARNQDVKTVTSELNRQLKGKDEELRRSMDTIGELEADKERLVRDKAAVEERWKELGRVLEMERSNVAKACESLKARITKAESDHINQSVDYEKANQSLRIELQRLQAMRGSTQGRSREEEEEMMRLRHELESLQEQLEEAREVAGHQAPRIDGLMKENESLHSKISLLDLKLAEMPLKDNALKDAEQRLAHAGMENRDELQRLKSRVSKLSEELAMVNKERVEKEGQLTANLARERSTLSEEISDNKILRIKAARLQVDLADAQTSMQEAGQRAAVLQVDADEMERQVNELTLQLAESFTRDQARISDQARIKGALARRNMAEMPPQQPMMGGAILSS